MYVNVSPSAVLCDETLHVLKFGALAQEVIIQPDRDASVADASISQFAPPLRPSRFQQYVRKSISLLSARASVLEPSFSMICEEDDRNGRIIELEEELARMKTEWEENEQKVRKSLQFLYFSMLSYSQSTIVYLMFSRFVKNVVLNGPKFVLE